MQYLLEEIPEDMAVRKETRDEIAKEVASQLATAIASLKPKGFRKAVFHLRELGPLATIIAVFLALLGITVGALYQSYSHIREEAEFRTRTADKLGDIEGRLGNIDDQLRNLRAVRSPSAVLKEISQLDQRKFPTALPALRTVAEQPVSDVKPSATTLQEILVRLRLTSQNSADYWPTVLQFIEFASSSMASNVPPPGPPTVLSENTIVGSKFGRVAGVNVVLDGGEIQDGEFVNCRIKFTEKPVVMKNVRFINCAFEMPHVDTPNPYLRNAGQILLASNLTSVSVPSL